MTEKTIVVCKICLVPRERYRAGKYPNGKDTKFTNKEGKEWSGRKCPQCHLDSTKRNQYLRRKGDL